MYAVTIVQGDGVPYDALETSDLNEALRERDYRRASPPSGSFFCGVMDLDDPERGWLEWPEDQ